LQAAKNIPAQHQHQQDDHKGDQGIRSLSDIINSTRSSHKTRIHSLRELPTIASTPHQQIFDANETTQK
jgi:hypothetical protein